MSTTWFEIRDNETGEIVGTANTYDGGEGYGIKVVHRGESSRLPHWDYDYEPEELVCELLGCDASLVATRETDFLGQVGLVVIKRYDENGLDENGRDWLGYDADGINEAGHSKYEEYSVAVDWDGTVIRRYESH